MDINWNFLFSLIATLIAMSGLLATWRKTSVAEGKHLEEIRGLCTRMTDIEREEEYLRGCSEENKLGINELKTDMKWVRDALAEIKGLLKVDRKIISE